MMQATSSFELTPSLCNGDLQWLGGPGVNGSKRGDGEDSRNGTARSTTPADDHFEAVNFFNGASATIQTTASRRGGLHSVNNDSLTWRDWFIWLFLLIVTMIWFLSFLNLEVLVLILVIIKLGAVEIMYVPHCPCRISYHPTDHKTVLPRCGLCK